MLLARSHSLIKLRRYCSISVFIRSLTVCSSSLLNNPSTSKPHFQNTAECPQFHFMFPRYFSSKTASSSSKQSLPLTRDGNYNEASPENLVVCPGCGVHMQDADPKHPGFFVKPSQKDPRTYRLHAHLEPVCQESEVSDFLKRGTVIEPETNDSDVGVAEVRHERPVVCARCHSLRHYGKVKDSTVENLLPDFDFDHTIGRKLVSTSGTRSVVLMVVDASDFDGSFPKKVANLVSDTIEEHLTAWKLGKSGNVPRVVLVVTKIDLLPSSISPTRFEHWVRQRAREGGSNKLTSVHLVSAVRDWGLKNLVDDVIALAGQRGNVWAIGAQNAGKSTLINSLGKHVGGKVSHLTEAPVPGTTLGIVRVEGVLPRQAKLFDTPGLLHPHQIATRLTREEQKLVYISKELKPRTYRIKAGHSVHIAGLMRLDVEELSVDSIYVTVWASVYLPLHMGKTENSCEMVEEHFGHQLQPPIGKARVKELGQWVRKEFRVCGNSWDSSSVDISAAGLGWFAIGLKGEAQLGVWTYDGIDVVLRNSLIPQRSQYFEVSGFTVSKIVSKADQSSNKALRQSEKKKPNNRKETTPANAEPVS
ncbi:GTP-binding protein BRASSINAZOLE INSENSITIVE PALE GREEN 2, chloroplastic-like [Cannabis sativa]|uniref:GTP-binding protein BRASSINAZOLE INSENSITIVE PALE GREEN 2, chloroplastic-like n=1 Tax=Cannabis sativa TaxID=3483 RepID=UPI0029C9F4B3|nr:GTP-binding protein BRASSINAZOLE INSENSITIVE PALE GREEN 2, chloroplastic-like [Cannabis sativa]XP_060966220.1 GTP-binding protein BRASSINAZOLE INSENSITIVE PALE GREEN 2, chloroplastic-like [Cannabis sativa]XP_060966221.1 GTP-binding protein BRASSINAZOLE INSENSITIVE PALE GREEN 2, chloroplastic-like [Cannabis sativa]XP_060966222.1 GTP-binding protein BRASSINAZOLE INSENSITIVE PALE GREEN 2, chloroplastic-like [Cannabis sativa]XP_060966223.1 GTP-binding protein BRASSINAZOLE INSENSITIVE PALE GREEN 